MVRLIPWLLVLVLVGSGGGYWLGRKHGGEAEARRQALAQADLFHVAVTRAAQAGAGLRAIGAKLVAALEASHTTETVTVREVIEVIRENPEFSAVRRPAELDSLRREQLEAIAAGVDPDQL